MPHLSIDFQRLKQDIVDLSSIGIRDNQGLYRMAFSAADIQARQWLQQRIRDAGLELYVDGAANIHARLAWDGQRPSVMTGSHLDTVPGAGHSNAAMTPAAALLVD